MTDNTNPTDKSQLDNAQSDVANEAMEGINRTDINQDNASTPTSKGSDESLLDMLHEAKKFEDEDKIKRLRSLLSRFFTG